MKAKVIETGKIIDVHCLYPVTYSRLDCNGKIIEEYDEDELEFICKKPKEKKVSLDKVCDYIKQNLYKHLYVYNGEAGFPTAQFLTDLRKAMED